jgi:hypothetical protein
MDLQKVRLSWGWFGRINARHRPWSLILNPHPQPSSVLWMFMLVDTNCGTSLFRDDPDSSDEDTAPKVDGLVALELFLVFVLRIRVGVRAG